MFLYHLEMQTLSASPVKSISKNSPYSRDSTIQI